MGLKLPFAGVSKAIERVTVTAGGAITIGRCVTYGSVQASSAGVAGWGVATSDIASGKNGTITTDGTEIAEAGAAISSAGLPLVIDATGRLIPAATTGHFIFARSITTAAAAGEYFEVQITREGKF